MKKEVNKVNQASKVAKALGMKSNVPNDSGSDHSNEMDEMDHKKSKKDTKKNNTIMQQINNFSLTPMNDKLAEQTIEDHKYLLELVENKCAIAFYAATNRNHSLYQALQSFVNQANLDEELEQLKSSSIPTSGPLFQLEQIFKKMMQEYDFMSVVMYPDLKNRREFIHDCWVIAKS